MLKEILCFLHLNNLDYLNLFLFLIYINYQLFENIVYLWVFRYFYILFLY